MGSNPVRAFFFFQVFSQQSGCVDNCENLFFCNDFSNLTLFSSDSKLRAQLGLKPLLLEDQSNTTTAMTTTNVQKKAGETSSNRRVSGLLNSCSDNDRCYVYFPGRIHLECFRIFRIIGNGTTARQLNRGRGFPTFRYFRGGLLS